MQAFKVYGLAALIASVSVGNVHAQVPAVTAEAEAKAFMQQYEQDLRLHRREALAARYSLRGAFFPAQSSATPLSFEAIGEVYRNESKWKGPETFDWRDLSYEVIGPDAIVVVGSFLWRDPSTSETVPYSYSSLLVRESGGLRIRLEHEAPQGKK